MTVTQPYTFTLSLTLSHHYVSLLCLTQSHHHMPLLAIKNHMSFSHCHTTTHVYSLTLSHHHTFHCLSNTVTPSHISLSVQHCHTIIYFTVSPTLSQHHTFHCLSNTVTPSHISLSVQHCHNITHFTLSNTVTPLHGLTLSHYHMTLILSQHHPPLLSDTVTLPHTSIL